MDDIEPTVAKLKRAGIPADWLDGSSYPQMTLAGGTRFTPPGPVAYGGPYDSMESATQACVRIDKVLDGQPPVDQSCLEAQPGPRS